MLAIEVLAQGIEALLEEDLERVHPGDDLSQWLGAQAQVP